MLLKLAEHARRLVFPAVVMGLSAALAAFSRAETVPQWAFPASNMPAPKGGEHAATRLSLPGSNRTFSVEALQNLYAAPDWLPDSYPPAPAIVLTGRPGVLAACGYCRMVRAGRKTPV